MAYDPTAETGIPTEPVGSLPRPDKLQAAYAEYDAGKIDKPAAGGRAGGRREGLDRARRGNRRPDHLRRRAVVVELCDLPGDRHAGRHGPRRSPRPGGQYFAIFADGHYRQLPKLVGGPFRYKTFAADTLKRSIKLASRPMKQAVIAPSMLALLYPLDEEISGYSREQFENDLVDECEKDIRGAFDAGAVRVSIDFTEGRLALREDSRNPWTGRGMLPHFVGLINGVLERFTPEERANIGVHTCPGGDRDSVHSADVPYSALLPSLFELNAGYFMMQCRSERDRESVYKLVGEHSRDDANGVPQVVFVGVINPQNPRVESAQEVCDELVAAAKHIPTERLGATDDCGFSPFSIDEKPLHGSADYARDIAFQKIENRVQGTKMAAEKLGVHVPAPA